MHDHFDMRNVTSNTHVRSSSGSSNETHSWRSSTGCAGMGSHPRGLPFAAMNALVDELRTALAPDRIRTDATELALYRRDASNISGGASVVCFPLDTVEVQACVRAARHHGVPFVAR